MDAVALVESASTANPKLVSTPSPAALATLQRTLARAGWEVDYLDLDLTLARPTASIRCHRADGRWLWAKVDTLGRCTLETFQRETWLGKPRHAKGNWPQSPQLDDVFLGRSRPATARALLRELSSYLAHNALHPTALTEVRSAWTGLLRGATRLTLPAR